MTTKVDQKEYLKRYLNLGDDKKQKKKKKKSKSTTQQAIIDDDIDLSKLQRIEDNDLEVFQAGEDAPQVVGVIDDRPPELRALDFKNSSKWKVINDDNGFDSNIIVQELDDKGRLQNADGKRKTKSVSFGSGSKNATVDLSPPRARKSPEQSPQLRRNLSPDPPRRRKISPDQSPNQKRRNSLDRSPQKRGQEERTRRSPSSDQSPRQKGSPDQSPKRRRRSPDQSPQRRKDNPDQSPPRRIKPSSSNRQTRADFDQSPPRKLRQSPEQSRRRRSSNRSPPRKSRKSPSPRYRKFSPTRRRRSPNSPRHRRRKSRERSVSPPPTHKKMVKTLDGKMAGIQSAEALRDEAEAMLKKERKIFSEMDVETSGRFAETVVRDRKTGRIRDMEQEMEKERVKEQKNSEKKQVYDRWGKGVKQVEEHRQRREEESHEMNKPVARYAGDGDLEDYLKRQERDGDPMLEYLRQKEKEKRKESGMPACPRYEGGFPDNRFNIRPGYRWDGVDRSNGYEKKWFDVQNKKKAGAEEAYRYSTEDM